MNTRTLGCRSSSCSSVAYPAVASGTFADRMVGLAGLGYGDTVVCMGTPGIAVEAAVCDAGAHILSITAAARAGEWKPLRFVKHARADVALWAADALRQLALAESLAALRQRLRPGGRLVLWATPDRCRQGPGVSQRLHRLVDAAGFTSVIAGRLPSEKGDVVVVTGILSRRRNNVF